MSDLRNNKKNPEMERVDSILKNTVDTMQEGRDEIFRISEKSRLEIMHREAELINTQNLIAYVIGEIEHLEKDEKSSKLLLRAISREPESFVDRTEQEVLEDTEKIRDELRSKRDLEEELKKKRTILEFYLKNAREVFKRTEELTNKMGSALEFLRGTLLDVLEESKMSRSLGMKIISLQEQERRRVSREIHDGPAQFMANVVMKADYCEKIIEHDSERAKGELKSLKRQVRESIADIRRIIFDLMPMSLEELGLIPTLDQYIDNVKLSKRINIEFNHSDNSGRKLENLVSLSVFRIVQESLNNSLKHAKAKNVKIELNIKKDKLLVLIEDDGIGFSTKSNKNIDISSGFGILGMRERVRLLNGSINIASTDEGHRGCRVKVLIPLEI